MGKRSPFCRSVTFAQFRSDRRLWCATIAAVVNDSVVYSCRSRRAGAIHIRAHAEALLLLEDFVRVAPVHFLCPFRGLVQPDRFATHLQGTQASELACRAPAVHKATGGFFEEAVGRGALARIAKDGLCELCTALCSQACSHPRIFEKSPVNIQLTYS